MTSKPRLIPSHQIDDQVVIPGLRQQMDMLGGTEPTANDEPKGRYFSAEEIDLSSYEAIVVCMSGGKDSIACLLHLIEQGVDMRKVELWHHDVDGREGSTLMDWTFMADYNRQLAHAFEVPLFFSWLKHGFEGEMLKENDYSHPQCVETPDGLLTLERDTRRSKPGTRLRFPQVSASLSTRWCSSSLKIDLGRRALNNQSRFLGTRTLFITGERREESANRARYFQLERHASDTRFGRKARHVDAWRPVLDWDENRVWETLERHGVLAPVPYRLGWSRSSCQACVFNSDAIWATIAHYFPEKAQRIADYEQQFGTTISRDKLTVLERARRSRPFEIEDLAALEQATRPDYTLPVFAAPGTPWVLPAGAFRSEGCGAS